MEGGSSDKEWIQTIPEAHPFRFKVWGSFAAAIFGLAILMLSLLAVSNPTAVFPNELSASEAGMIKTAEEVKYYLPYPGVLPDSPLYKIKMIRDGISLFLIRDPAKKADKQLLYADKRINAAVVLMEGGKSTLGVSTATKAEKYLDQSSSTVISLQKQNNDVKSQLLTLQKAAAKHVQLLLEMRDKLEGNERITIERAIKESQMVLEKVDQALRDSA